MHIILNNSSVTPIYEQLIEQIKAGIMDGSLQPDEALPSVRALSATLRISALTVKKAYDRLEELGFIITVHGKGSFVAAANMQLAAEARRKSVEDDFARAIEKAKTIGLTREEILEMIGILLSEE